MISVVKNSFDLYSPWGAFDTWENYRFSYIYPIDLWCIKFCALSAVEKTVGAVLLPLPMLKELPPEPGRQGGIQSTPCYLMDGGLWHGLPLSLSRTGWDVWLYRITILENQLYQGVLKYSSVSVTAEGIGFNLKEVKIQTKTFENRIGDELQGTKK